MNYLGLRDFRREYEFIKNKINPALTDIIKNGHFILGKDLEKFEVDFAEYCGCLHAVGVASGTAALHLALTALGLKKGDEVITTSMSFNATAEAIALTGATPVFIDVNEKNLSIDVQKIEARITKKTRAILPVHLYGIPVEIEKIMRICRKHKLFLVEDCAQAHGSLFQNRHVGSFGDIGCFSFMPSKNLGCFGDAGCIVTNNQTLAEKIKKLRNHGRTTKYIHDELGFAERMDNLQAAVLNIKLKFLDKWNQRRQEIAKTYDTQLDLSKIKRIETTPKSKNSYYVYNILVKNREELSEALREKNIETGIYYPLPLHLQPVFKDLGYKEGDLPIVERLAKKILAIPMHPFLKENEIEYIISQVNKYA